MAKGNPGKFIVVDGNEGAGKSTMVKMAKEIYGDSLFVTREPGGTPLAEDIRHLMLSTEGGRQSDAKTQFNLIWAARTDHFKNKIKPHLDEGLNVLSDRLDSTTWAYQVYAQGNEGLKELFKLERQAILGDHKPDLYIFLDVDIAEGMRRRKDEGGETSNHLDDREPDFHRKAKEGFLEFFKTVPSRRIDANQPIEKVEEEFLKILTEVFGPPDHI